MRRVKYREIIIVLIYILVFCSAFFYMQSQLLYSESWRRLYLISMYGIVLLCCLFILTRKRIRLYIIVSLLGILVIYELIVSLWCGLFNFPRILIDTAGWPLLFTVFVLYCREYRLPDCFKSITITGFLVICAQSLVILTRKQFRDNGGALFSTYYCMAFLPLVYLYASKKMQAAASVLVVILMLLSSKRAAFVIVVVGVAFFYFLGVYIQNSSRKRTKRFLKFLFGIVIALIVGYYLIRRLNIDVLDRLLSAVDDGGSGRTRIWTMILSLFKQSSLSERVFGHGFQSVYYVVRPSGISRFAHNSLIEYLYDCGYIGLFLILSVQVMIIAFFIRLMKIKHPFCPAFGYTLIPMIVLSLLSYFFEQSVIIVPICIVWGICMGCVMHEQELQRTEPGCGSPDRQISAQM